MNHPSLYGVPTSYMEGPKAFIFSGDQRDVLRHDDISAALDVEEGQGDTQTGG